MELAGYKVKLVIYDFSSKHFFNSKWIHLQYTHLNTDSFFSLSWTSPSWLPRNL